LVDSQLEIWVEPDGPVYVDTPEEAEALLDRVAAQYEHDWPVLVEVDIADSVGTEQLVVGVHRGMGVVFYTSPEHLGCYSRGEPTDFDGELTYYYMRNERQYPPDAQVPLATVKLAVREFMATGGERPQAVAWQTFSGPATPQSG
jgi:hypothetical protein